MDGVTGKRDNIQFGTEIASLDDILKVFEEKVPGQKIQRRHIILTKVDRETLQKRCVIAPSLRKQKLVDKHKEFVKHKKETKGKGKNCPYKSPTNINSPLIKTGKNKGGKEKASSESAEKKGRCLHGKGEGG